MSIRKIIAHWMCDQCGKDTTIIGRDEIQRLDQLIPSDWYKKVFRSNWTEHFCSKECRLERQKVS